MAQQSARDLGGYATPEYFGTTLYSGSWALVIGIDVYQKPIPALQYAERDARDVAALLPSLGFPQCNIRTLLGSRKEVTRERILSALDEDLNSGMGADDRLLIYFAGHGVSSEIHGESHGHLLLPGSRVHGEWPTAERMHLDHPPSGALQMENLLNQVRGLPAKHKLLLIDACFSGFMARSPETQGAVVSNDPRLARWAASPVTQVLTAGRSGERASEMARYGHGVFTHYVLEALRGHADPRGDGLITFSELVSFVRDRVGHERDVSQDPQPGKFGGEGEFLFVRPAATPVATLGEGSDLPAAFLDAVRRVEERGEVLGRALGPVERVGDKGEVQRFEGAGGFECCIARAAGASEAYCVGGVIYEKYQSKSGPACPWIGFPRSDEQQAATSRFGTRGRFNHFRRAEIDYHETGPLGCTAGLSGKAFIVNGAIAHNYIAMGGTGSLLGFPVSDEYTAPGGSQSNFEGGSIYWRKADERISKLIRLLDTTFSDSPFAHGWEQYDGDIDLNCLNYAVEDGPVSRFLSLRASATSKAVRFPGVEADNLGLPYRYCGVTFRASSDLHWYIRVADGKYVAFWSAQARAACPPGLEHEWTRPLARSLLDGSWHTLVVDLEEEVKQGFGEPHTAVECFCFRHDVDIANVYLSDDMEFLQRSVLHPAEARR